VEQGHLWVLQTRTASLGTRAAVQIAVDMVREGIIEKSEALERIDPGSLARLLHPEVDPGAKKDILTQGIAASPGAAFGPVVFNSDDAEVMKASGQNPVLVRPETRPEDVHGIAASVAILTSRGGATSHAAVVARAMGRPCVTGAAGLQVNAGSNYFTVGNRVVAKGDVVTVDGTNGIVCLGAAPLVQPDLGEVIEEFLGWSDGGKSGGGSVP
jgi:pyruvate,orthophosphate dikinase